MKFRTEDSGKREEYRSGMRRDTQDNKPDFYLITPKDMPYSEQPLIRWAELMTRGKNKYGLRNWELADSEEELDRFKSSALRHMYQWLCEEEGEDHMAAILFNVSCAEYVRWKLKKRKE